MEILSSALFRSVFGLKEGVILLGCVWAVWHLPIDFFYYTTPDMGLAALASQFITCITIGLFMAYAYMKTQNIWVPVIIHFLGDERPWIRGSHNHYGKWYRKYLAMTPWKDMPRRRENSGICSFGGVLTRSQEYVRNFALRSAGGWE